MDVFFMTTKKFIHINGKNALLSIDVCGDKLTFVTLTHSNRIEIFV